MLPSALIMWSKEPWKKRLLFRSTQRKVLKKACFDGVGNLMRERKAGGCMLQLNYHLSPPFESTDIRSFSI